MNLSFIAGLLLLSVCSVIVYVIMFAIGNVVVSALTDMLNLQGNVAMLRAMRCINVVPVLHLIYVVIGIGLLIVELANVTKRYIFNGETPDNDDDW